MTQIEGPKMETERTAFGVSLSVVMRTRPLCFIKEAIPKLLRDLCIVCGLRLESESIFAQGSFLAASETIHHHPVVIQ